MHCNLRPPDVSSILLLVRAQFGLDSAESDVTFDRVFRPLIGWLGDVRPASHHGDFLLTQHAPDALSYNIPCQSTDRLGQSFWATVIYETRITPSCQISGKSASESPVLVILPFWMHTVATRQRSRDCCCPINGIVHTAADLVVVLKSCYQKAQENRLPKISKSLIWALYAILHLIGSGFLPMSPTSKYICKKVSK